MAKLNADKADAHMTAKQEAQASTPEEQKAHQEWSPALGKIDESNRVDRGPVSEPEKLSVDERAAVIRARNEMRVPQGPCIQFEIVGRAVRYGEDGKKLPDEYIEQTIFFPTVGNKDIETVRRYREEKAYAVVAYHNFPPREHKKFAEYEALQRELDGIINPPEQRRRYRG